MTALAALLDRMSRQGIRLRLNAGEVDVIAPSGERLPPDLVDQLRARRVEVRAVLRAAAGGEVRDFEVRMPPRGGGFIARCPDPVRLGHDRAVVVRQGDTMPPASWAWREVGCETWYRVKPRPTTDGSASTGGEG